MTTTENTERVAQAAAALRRSKPTAKQIRAHCEKVSKAKSRREKMIEKVTDHETRALALALAEAQMDNVPIAALEEASGFKKAYLYKLIREHIVNGGES